MKPRIKLTLTTFDKAIETAGIVLLAVLWICTLLAWYKLPATIPVHFNAAGLPDRYGNKITLFILPLLATAVYTPLTALNRYPHIFNYIVPITENNAQQQYLAATRLLRILKLSITLICLVIVAMTYFTNRLGAWFLPFVLVLLTAPTVYYVWQAQRRDASNRHTKY